MESKPRRGRLRRWAALLAALLCRGGAWVRRAAAALHNRLGRRRVALKPGGPRGEARSARTARGPSDRSNRAAAQEERHGSSPSARARRLRGHRAHGKVGDASAAAALGPGEDAATGPWDHRKDGEQGGSRGNTDRNNQQGRRQEGGESPRGTALGEDIDGANAHGEDATADGAALGWYPGGEPTKTGDSSVGVAPGAATHRKHGGPNVDDEQDGEEAGRSKNLPAPRPGMAPEEDPERGGGTIAGPKTTGAGEDTVGQGAISIAAPPSPTRASSPPAAALVRDEDEKTEHGAEEADGHGGCSGGERAQTSDGHGEVGNAISAAALDPGEVTGASNLLGSPTAPEGLGTSPRAAAMVPDKKSMPEHGGEARDTGDRSVAPGPAKEEPQERHAAIDAPIGGSEAVLVQPGLAAAPAGRSGNGNVSSRGRRRVVPRKKAAAPSPDPLLPIDEEGDVDIKEDRDQELKLHQTYRDKVAVCRKHYTYCLMCHLENRETELRKDQEHIVKHGKPAHGCPGILCIKTGCFARAKCKRDIGLHQYVSHKI